MASERASGRAIQRMEREREGGRGGEVMGEREDRSGAGDGEAGVVLPISIISVLACNETGRSMITGEPSPWPEVPCL
eukprot:3050999-Pleurochrysis_carterae.AAC.1